MTKNIAYAFPLAMVVGCTSNTTPEEISAVFIGDPVPSEESLPDPLCSYDSPEEQLEEKIARLGNQHEMFKEVIGGHNQINENRLNIIFIGVEYTNEELLELIHKGVDCSQNNNGLLTKEPFSSNLENINFWYGPLVEEVSGEPNKSANMHKAVREMGDQFDASNKTYVGLFNLQMDRAHAGFSFLRNLNLYELNLENIGEYKGLYGLEECNKVVKDVCHFGDQNHEICGIIEDLKDNEVMHKPYLNWEICKLISSESLKFSNSYIGIGQLKTLTHELGHSTAGLRDEYLDDERFNNMTEQDKKRLEKNIDHHPLNCYLAETKNGCLQEAPWNKDVEDQSCFEGCNYGVELFDNKMWRATENSIMRSVNEQPDWWQIRQWCNVFQVVNQNPTGICDEIL